MNETITVPFEPYKWDTASPEFFHINSNKLNAFFEKISEWENLRSVLIIRDNKLIVEKYYNGYNKRSAYNVFSITKSITSALIGIAIKQKFIRSEDEIMMSYFPEYAKKINDPGKNAITLKHLLTMTGGLKPKEWWSPGIDYALLEASVEKKPGEKFLYYNALPNLLSAIISRSTKLSIKKFAEIYLFEPLGMKCAFWKKDGEYYSGRSNTYFTSRDLARLGSLYLNKGVINGEQIIDSSWIDKSFKNYAESDKNFFLTGESLNQTGYGYLWWTLETDDEVYYSAYGAGDQFLLINPKDNTIVVIGQIYKDTWFEKKENIDMVSELLSIIHTNKDK
ncbi:MAG: serine hydrolase [Acidobacteriota bacterium]